MSRCHQESIETISDKKKNILTITKSVQIGPETSVGQQDLRELDNEKTMFKIFFFYK